MLKKGKYTFHKDGLPANINTLPMTGKEVHDPCDVICC